jgi:copper chaperone CopZ
MKKIFISIAILFTALLSQAQFSSASLTAAGLTCAMCTKAIYNALEKIPFVNRVDADINNSSFIITFKENATVDPDQLKNAVEDAGFSLSRLKLTGDFNNQVIEKDTHVTINGKMFHFLAAGKKTLNGQETITMVDKNYVSAKEFKKYKSSTEYSCVETGKAGQCCAKNGLSANTRIYHVTI